MKLENRKLYSHGQNPDIFLLQIPKIFSRELGLTKDTLIDIELIDDKLIVSKVDKEQNE